MLKQKVETLQADLSRRQESYIRRERAFNVRIEELEEEIGSLKVQRVEIMRRHVVHHLWKGDASPDFFRLHTNDVCFVNGE